MPTPKRAATSRQESPWSRSAATFSGIYAGPRAAEPLPRVAMAIGGHKTRAVFERCNIVSGRDLKDAARKLETYLAQQNGNNWERAVGRASGNPLRRLAPGPGLEPG